MRIFEKLPTFKKVLAAVWVMGLVLAGAPSGAVASDVEPFVAVAVQKVPGQSTQSGKIFVSGQDTRFEFVDHGREVVQIIRPEQKVMRILFPQDKVYMEIAAPDAPMVKSNETSPCPKVEGMSCVKEGMDQYNDIAVERWNLTFKDPKGSSLLWWEPERKMVLRQEFKDGRVMQLQLVGEVDFDGRKAERWDVSYAMPGAPVSVGMRLVDRNLGIIVLERDPSGMSRELRELKIVKADAEWFTVPDGFKRIEEPKPEAAQPRPQ